MSKVEKAFAVGDKFFKSYAEAQRYSATVRNIALDNEIMDLFSANAGCTLGRPALKRMTDALREKFRLTRLPTSSNTAS